jgi:hypothetical protein
MMWLRWVECVWNLAADRAEGVTENLTDIVSFVPHAVPDAIDKQLSRKQIRENSGRAKCGSTAIYPDEIKRQSKK